MSQPEHGDVNEILFRPTRQELGSAQLPTYERDDSYGYVARHVRARRPDGVA